MELSELAAPSGVFGLAKSAYAGLSDQAKGAVESWETMNWTGGVLEKHILADDDVAKEVEAAFKPVRAALPETITLYRGIIIQDQYKGWEKSLLQSWTTDRRVAELFAGLRHGSKFTSLLYPETSEEEIKQAVAQYKRSGFVKFRSRYYVRNKDLPRYYNIYDKHKQYITDGDDIEHDLSYDNEFNREFNDDKRKKAKVLEEEIPRDRVVWITNRLNCKEFLVLR